MLIFSMTRVKSRTIPFIVLCAFLLSGCLPTSLEKYYDDNDVIDPPPGIVGEWLPQIFAGDSVKNKKIHPWIFSDNRMEAYDGENKKAFIETVYFKIGDNIFCDSFPAEPDTLPDKPNSIWIMHITPIHILTKVEIHKDKLVFIPLDIDWFAKNNKKKVSMKYMKGQDYFTFTETPRRWRDFLLKYGNSKEVFAPKLRYEFAKVHY